ncbi:HDOD domain-containing protein [Fluctibacter halophilus]
MKAIDYATQASDVFVLPDAVVRIRALIDDEAASMMDIAEVVQYDPALATQILKIANSALYKFPNQIDSIAKAIQVIGTNSMYDLVVGYGVAKAFGAIDTDIIDLDKFWEQSVCCALLCKYFAERRGTTESERLFVAGLLHNIGELVTVQFDPEVARKCAHFNEQHTPLSLQLEHLGMTYADIGAALIRLWGIPNAIATPIEHQHFSISEAQNDDDRIMQLSYVLALDNVNSEYYSGNANLDMRLCDVLELEHSDLQSALSYTNLQSLSVFALFNPSGFAVY